MKPVQTLISGRVDEAGLNRPRPTIQAVRFAACGVTRLVCQRAAPSWLTTAPFAPPPK
jgi:hypothetical protein